MRICAWILFILSFCNYHVFAAVRQIPSASFDFKVAHASLYCDVLPGTSLGKPQFGISDKRFYKYDETILDAARHYKVDPFFIKAILVIESGLNPAAVSRANARGIAQFMHTTAKTLGIVDRHNPDESIWGCAALVSKLGKRFDGNMCLVAAAYNAGPQAIVRAGRELTRMGRETQRYVPSVMNVWKAMCCHYTASNQDH
jgi:soluble lytic murein transglycosylase-like protein